MYDVEKGSEPPQEDSAEQRLHKCTRRIQEIDKEVESLRGQREAAAREIKQATEKLQNSIEKAHYVLRKDVKADTANDGY